ncbi:hypothetical protein C8F01DRAFT_1083507 [Mycena amicta]|nr:hypothetical protein C8F01DRAFT_1083507 [Mycena amicta]
MSLWTELCLVRLDLNNLCLRCSSCVAKRPTCVETTQPVVRGILLHYFNHTEELDEFGGDVDGDGDGGDDDGDDGESFTRAVMVSPHLANELLARIVTFIDRSTLQVFVLTNSHFYALGTEKQVRHLMWYGPGTAARNPALFTDRERNRVVSLVILFGRDDRKIKLRGLWPPGCGHGECRGLGYCTISDKWPGGVTRNPDMSARGRVRVTIYDQEDRDYISRLSELRSLDAVCLAETSSVRVSLEYVVATSGKGTTRTDEQE